MIARGTAEEILPLDLLQAGEEASIVELIGNESQVHRLAEMGLRVGHYYRARFTIKKLTHILGL